MRTIYLCGAINGCTDDECREWRETVKAGLAAHFRFLDPMRRDYRGREDLAVRQIVEGDYRDIAESDIILVRAEVPSWGTAMEVHQAFMVERKYVVAVCGAARISPWLRYHTHRIEPTLEAAMTHLREVATDPELLATLQA